MSAPEGLPPRVDEVMIVPPATLDEAILRAQGSSVALDLRRNADAERGSARHRRYLDYPKLLAEMRPVLQANMLTWQAFPTTIEEEGKQVPALRYVVTFVPTREHQEDRMKLMLDKATSQAQGSALTYAKRYALQAVFDLAPDGDDDGEEASQAPRPVPYDPESPLAQTTVDSMREAIAERGLSYADVLRRVGADPDGPVLQAHGKKVKELLAVFDAQKAKPS